MSANFLNRGNLAKLKDSPLALTGERVCLRLLRAEDLAMTLAWRNSSDIRRWFIHSEIITWEQHLAWWQEYQDRYNDFVFIIEDKQTNKPVGQVSLYNIDLKKKQAEYGRLIIGSHENRSRGFAREATELLLSWAFDYAGLKQIYLKVFNNNIPAISLYKRCGFKVCKEQGELLFMCLAKGTRKPLIKEQC